MKNSSKLKLIVSAIAIMLLVIGILIGTTISNQKSCEENPFTFAVKQLEKLNDANFTCSCSPLDYSLETFYFDEDGLYAKNPFTNFD